MFKPAQMAAWALVLAVGWGVHTYFANWRNPWTIQAPNFPQKVGCTKECKS